MLAMRPQHSLGRHAVEALLVLAEAAQVAALCHGQVFLVPLQAEEANGRSLPALPQARDVSALAARSGAKAVPARSLLAVADRRRILLMAVQRRPAGDKAVRNAANATVLRALPLAEEVLSMAWVADALFLGTPAAYLRQSLRERDKAAPPQLLFSLPPDAKAPALVRVLAPAEVLLLLDEVGVVVSSAGVPAGGSLLLRQVPDAIAFSAPYVCAAARGSLDVYHRHSGRLVQALAFPDAGLTPCHLADDSSSGLLALATSSSVPIEEQLKELLKAGQYEDALAVAASDDVSVERDEEAVRLLVSTVHAEAGFLCLQDLKFDIAVDYFLQSQKLQPTELFHYFPRVTKPWQNQVARRRYWGLHAPPQAIDELIKDRVSQVAAEALGAYHSSVTDIELKAKAAFARYFATMRTRSLAVEMQEGVDTLLFHLYLEMNATQELESLASSTNACRLVDVEDDLLARGHVRTLALLLESLGNLERALEVWAALFRGKDAEGADGPSLSCSARDAARVLRRLSDTDLVLDHLKWLLEVDSMQALSVLTSSDSEKVIPPGRVLSLLGSNHLIVKCRYLTWAVLDCASQDISLHTELALALADLAKAPTQQQQVQHASVGRESNEQSEPDATGKGDWRELLTLNQFLRTSELYDANVILQHIQSSDLWEEQVILLEKLGRHSAALRVLALKLHAYKTAEQYCTSLRRPALFVELLDMYLRPGEGQTPLLGPAVQLLQCHSACLDPLLILQELHDSLDLRSCVDLLAHVLCERVHRHRQGQIERQLARGLNLCARVAAVKAEARSVLVNDERGCWVCHARIGTKLFAAYPNDVLVCYPCLRQTGPHVCPISGQDFRSEPARRRQLLSPGCLAIRVKWGPVGMRSLRPSKALLFPSLYLVEGAYERERGLLSTRICFALSPVDSISGLVYLPFSMDSETHWGCTRQAAQVGERKDFWGVGGGYSKFLCWKVEDRQGGFLSRARAEILRHGHAVPTRKRRPITLTLRTCTPPLN
eukprot:SM000071S21136  [mRNA]  locus=s71:514624:520820:- [translate_table: standard]